MKMTRAAVAVFLVGFVLLSNTGEAANTPPDAPGPAPDCSTLILSLVDCMPFVSNNTETSPKGTCCDGLKNVLKTDARCLCEAFNQSAQLGLKINITKALTLPSVCHVSAPPITNCGLSPHPAPAVAPAVSPVAPSPNPAPAPIIIVAVPGTGNSTNSTTPATAPTASSSSTLASGALVLLVAIVVSSFSLF